MKLYYVKGTCSLSVRIILNELGLNFEAVNVNLANKKMENGKNYLTINPKGAVPALLTDGGELLTENTVILQYLADNYDQQHHLLASVNDFQRTRALEWLNFISSDLHKGVVPVFIKPFKAAINDLSPFLAYLKSKLQYANDSLSHKTYLLGDDFSLPDAYLFVVASWMKLINIDLSTEFPQLDRYVKFLAKRPSIIQSLQQEA